MTPVSLPPDNYTLDILNWLKYEIYPGLLQEPWTDRAEAVWVAGDRGFVGLWAGGYAVELPPAERLEACRQELYRRIYAVKFPVGQPAPPTPPPVVTPPPVTPPSGSLRRIQGQLRVQGQVYVDDHGPVLPLFWHFGEAFSAFVRRPLEVLAELDDIAATGYQGIRFWDVLGYHDQSRPGDPNVWIAWAGREVTPVRFTAFSGRIIEPTPHYYDQLVEFLRACRDRGLVVNHSRGDLNAWRWDQIQHHCRQVGDIQRSVGVTTIAVNEACNESWQNGVPEPSKLKQMCDLLGSGPLKGTSAADDGYGGELPDSVRDYAYDVHMVHGYRGGESHNRIAHIHALGFETLPHYRKAGDQSEPAGPGDGVSVGREEHPEALCLMGAMALCTRQKYVAMSGAGVFWKKRMAEMTAYRELARVPALLPQDIMTWPTITHGGDRFRGQRVLVAHNGTDPAPFYRADHILSGNEFVCLIYGEHASHRVPVEKSFEGVIITPHTGEKHPLTGEAGRALDIAFERGRIVIGRVV